MGSKIGKMTKKLRNKIKESYNKLGGIKEPKTLPAIRECPKRIGMRFHK